jgi:hypothetical protein
VSLFPRYVNTRRPLDLTGMPIDINAQLSTVKYGEAQGNAYAWLLRDRVVAI